MWNCPKCRSEVDDGFEVCWSCGTAQDGREDPTFKQALADDGAATAVAPPPPSTAIRADDRFVTIASFFSSGRAHVLRCLLEAEGIPVFMGEDSSFSGTLDCKLRVREADQEKALKILAELPPESTAEDDEKTVELPRPPEVAAPPPAPVQKRGWFGWLWSDGAPAAPQPLLAEPPPVVEEPRQVTAWEALRALESELSNLMDRVASTDWKVNPAFHPDVNAFIQKHSNNSAFMQKARGLQQNRARYYVKMRELEQAPKPPPESEPSAESAATESAPAAAWTPGAPAGPSPASKMLNGGLRFLRRLVKLTVMLVVALVVLGLFGLVGYRQYGKKQLDDAISETNKLDTGWQWDSLLANRQDVPAEENAALVVLKVAKLLPDGFAESCQEAMKLRLEPLQPLPPEISTLVAEQPDKVRQAVEEGLALDQLKTGRYPEPEPAAIEKRGSPGHAARSQAAALYWLESLGQAEKNQGDAALRAGRIGISVGRSVGDDPAFSVQQHRIHCVRDACRGLERVLARTTTASDESLAETQRLLTDEIELPLLRLMLRGDRAQWFVWSGQPDALDDPADAEPLRSLKRFAFAGVQAQARAQQLRARNRAIQQADGPVEELPPLEDVSLLAAPIGAYQRHQAQLRTTLAAIACERYRLAHGQWPTSLDQLVPQFLPAVPLDPFTGKPLRLDRRDAGLTIYSAGPDRLDDPGKREADADIGFRLHDLNRRRQ